VAPDPDRADGDGYVGRSEFLLWAPKVMLVLAVIVYQTHWNHSIHFAALFVVTAFIHSRWLPCRFRILDNGLELAFPFGRHLFVAKAKATIRVDLVGAFALVGARRRFGYPLLDGILYQPGHQSMLRDEFLARGYDVT
jgi:hypothetical protein